MQVTSFKNLRNNESDLDKFANFNSDPSDTLTSAAVSNGVTNLLTGVINDDHEEVGAFEYRSKLSTVKLPEGLATIGPNSFYGCTALKTINLPLSIMEIHKCKCACLFAV